MEKQCIPRGCIQMSTGSDQQPLQLILGNKDNNLEISFTPGKCRKTKAFHMNRDLWIPPPAKTTRRIRPCCLYKYPTNEITLHLQDDRSCSSYGLPMVIESKHLENFKAILYPYCENRQIKIDKNVSQKGIEDCKKHIETNYLAQCNVLKESEKLLNEQENKRKALKRYISVLKRNMDDISRSISEVRNIRNNDHELGLEKKVSTQWNAPEICKEDMYEMRFMKPSRGMDTGKEHDSERDIVGKCSDHKDFEITAMSKTSSFERKRGDQREYKEHRYSAASNGKSESSSETDQRSNKEVENLMMKLADSIRISKQLIDSIYDQEGDVNALQRKYIKGAEALFNSQQKLLEELNQVKDIDSGVSSRNSKKEGRTSCSEHENLLKKASAVHDSTFQLDDFEIDANNTINKIKHKKVKLTSSPCFEIYKQKHILEEQLAQARLELKDLQNKLETSKYLGIQSLTVDNKEKLKDGESKEMTKEAADSKMFKEYVKPSKNHIKPSSEEIPVYFLKEFNSHEILHRKAEKPKSTIPQAQSAPPLLEELHPIHETSHEDDHQFATKKSSSDILIKPISKNEVSDFRKQSSGTRKSLLPVQDFEDKRKTDKINEKYPDIVKAEKYDKMPPEDEDSFKESYLFNQRSYSKTASNEGNRINSFINRRPTDAMLSEDNSNSRQFYPLTPVQESFDSNKYDEVSHCVTPKDQDSFKKPYLFSQRSHSKTANNERNRINSFINRRPTDAMLSEDNSNSRQFYPLTPVQESFDSDKHDEMSHSVTPKDQDSFKEPYLSSQRSHSKTARNENNHANGFINRRPTDAMLLEDSSNSRQFHPVTPVERSSGSFGTPDSLIYGSLDETSEELDSNEIHTAINAKLRQMQDLSKLASKNSSGFEMRGRSKSEPYGTTFEKSPEKERRAYSCFAPIENQERLSGFENPEVARRKGIRAFYREHYPTENKKSLDQKVYEESDPKCSHQILERQTESEELQQFTDDRSAENELSLDHSDKESSEELHSYDLPSSFINVHSSEDTDFDGKKRKSKLQSTPLPNRFLLHPDIRNRALPRESQTFSPSSTSTNWASPNLKYVITTTPDKSDLPLRRKLFESNRPYRSSPEISDIQKASHKINTLYHQIMS